MKISCSAVLLLIVLFHCSGRNSSISDFHQKIYLSRKDARAIMHVHSPYVTAWATVGKMIPIVTQQPVPILKNAAIVPYYPVGSIELVDSIIRKYQNPDTRIVFMENHGTFLVGSNLYDLLYRAEVVESTATQKMNETIFWSKLIPGVEETLCQNLVKRNLMLDEDRVLLV